MDLIDLNDIDDGSTSSSLHESCLDVLREWSSYGEGDSTTSTDGFYDSDNNQMPFYTSGTSPDAVFVGCDDVNDGLHSPDERVPQSLLFQRETSTAALPYAETAGPHLPSTPMLRSSEKKYPSTDAVAAAAAAASAAIPPYSAVPKCVVSNEFLSYRNNIYRDPSPHYLDGSYDTAAASRGFPNLDGVAVHDGTGNNTEVGEENAEFSTSAPLVDNEGSARNSNEVGCSGILENDIVCGRDGVAHGHPGNRRFRKIVRSFRTQYQSTTSRKKKSAITKMIIRIIRYQYGGRLMKRRDDDEGSTLEDWVEASDEYFYEKVSHALRSARAPSNDSKPRAESEEESQKKRGTPATERITNTTVTEERY